MSTTTGHPQPSAANKPQRDDKGRFINGNIGGPGNPFGRRVAELRKILLRSATAENIERLANMLMEKAFAGDLNAAKLLLQYWLGKPKEVVDPDRVDIDDWELAQARVVHPTTAQEIFGCMPITIGLASMPALAEVHMRQFRDAMVDPEKFVREMDDEPTLEEEESMIREMRQAAAEEENRQSEEADDDEPPACPAAPARVATAPGAHRQTSEEFASQSPVAAPPSPNGHPGAAPRSSPSARQRAKKPSRRAG
jgi:hypothetical protein